MITQQPQNITGELFSKVQLTCLAAGNPQPEIYWYKDGARVTIDSTESSQLVIEEIRPDNRGFYHCQAVNSAGSVNSSTVLVKIKGMLVHY